MTSAAIVNDVEITANVPGIVVDNSGITISNSEKKDNDIIKCGSLWKRSSGIATARVSSRGKYFVLTKAALEYYRNEKCVSDKDFHLVLGNFEIRLNICTLFNRATLIQKHSNFSIGRYSQI